MCSGSLCVLEVRCDQHAEIPLAPLPSPDHFRPHFLLTSVSVHWLPRSCSSFTLEEAKVESECLRREEILKNRVNFQLCRTFQILCECPVLPGSHLIKEFSGCSLSQFLIWFELLPELY